MEFIEPGAMRTPLHLEQLVPIADGLGGYRQDWREVGFLHGRIEPLGARSRTEAAQLRQKTSHRIVIRFRQDVAARMRFRKEGRIFTIETVIDPDESRRYLVCLCEEVRR